MAALQLARLSALLVFVSVVPGSLARECSRLVSQLGDPTALELDGFQVYINFSEIDSASGKLIKSYSSSVTFALSMEYFMGWRSACSLDRSRAYSYRQYNLSAYSFMVKYVNKNFKKTRQWQLSGEIYRPHVYTRKRYNNVILCHPRFSRRWCYCCQWWESRNKLLLHRGVPVRTAAPHHHQHAPIAYQTWGLEESNGVPLFVYVMHA